MLIKMEDLLRKALETMEEMLEDRNYIALYDGIPEIDIIKRMNNKEYITPTGKLAFVTIVDSTSQIKNYTSYIENPYYETIIFIYTNNVTIAHRSIEQKLNFKIEIWCVHSLLINVVKHSLQPKIELILDNLLHKAKIPKIDINDPIVRYYKFKHKDILKITSLSGDISFRIVT